MEHRFNNIKVRTPTSFNWDLIDLEVGDTYRDANGLLHYFVLDQKRAISYKWLDPSAEEVASILQLVNQSSSIDITYPDALSGVFETRKFRPLKRSAPFRNLRVGAKLYAELSLEFEEL